MRKFIAVMTILLVLFSLVPLPASVSADDSKVSIVFIGDSRTVGMQLAVEEEEGLSSQFTWICKQSESHSWVEESTQWNQLSSLPNRGNTIVVYLMGVNNLNATENIRVLNKIADLGFKDVYFGEVLPVNPSKYPPGSGYSVTNDSINKFNKAVSESTDKKYRVLSLNSSVSAVDGASDGLHYNNVSYRKVFELILNQLGITSISPISKELATTFKAYAGRAITDEDAHNISLVVESLRTEGFSDNAIAGVLGNIKAESGFKPYAIEGYTGSDKLADGDIHCANFEAGNSYKYSMEPSYYNYGDDTGVKKIGGVGHGLVQWSFGRAYKLNKIIDDNPDMFGYVTVTHYIKCSRDDSMKETLNSVNNKYFYNLEVETCRIPNGAGQVALLMSELKSSSYKSVYDTLAKADVTVKEASTKFLQEYEIPSTRFEEETINTRSSFGDLALPLVKSINGVISSTRGNNGVNGNTSDVEAISNFMQLHGYWSEEQISSFSKLNETNISAILDKVSRDNLSGSQLESLDNWKDINDDSSKQGGVLYWVRVLTMWVGILLVVWAVLLYVGFWFDRSNNFIDFSIVGILTLGKLNASLTDEDSTFGKKDVKGVKTINSRELTIICICCVVVGVLIISGLVYRVLASLVNLVRGLIF